MSDEIRKRIADWLYDGTYDCSRYADSECVAEQFETAIRKAVAWRDAQWCRALEEIFRTVERFKVRDDTKDFEDAVLAGIEALERDEATLRDAHRDYKCGGPAECEWCQAELSWAEMLKDGP